MRRMGWKVAVCLGGAALGLLYLVTSCATVTTQSGNAALADPPVFTSANGVLDLLVIARASTVQLGSAKPTAWVFEICQTAVAQGDACPADTRTAAPYGGVRLQLSPGDHLRMRLVNHLPPAPDDAENAHGDDPMMNEMLAANPVNIHTHGLIVEPRKADDVDPTYGDYVYVLGYPAGKLPGMIHPDETATDQPIQYDIDIPADHPSGIFWFHPHVHGLGVNQLSEGLSGVITIGSVSDYASSVGALNLTERYVVLKDMQVLASGEAQDQEDPDFCEGTAASGEMRDGFCAGKDNSKNADDPGTNYTGGKWFFTVNGQVYPEIGVHRGSGEVWRLLNTGPSRAYNLEVDDDTTHAPLTFQVVSLDGVALAPPAGSGAADIRAATANKVDAVPCALTQSGASQPVCATHLVMLPSARAEIWIANPASGTRKATLRTKMVNTGSDGDDWPEANLAHVTFDGGTGARAALLQVKPVEKQMLSGSGLLGAPVRATFAGAKDAMSLQNARAVMEGKAAAGAGLNAQQVKAIRSQMAALSKPVTSIASVDCAALPAGHRRRIFFGTPASNPDAFGLGYEEVDANGEPVPGTFQDVAEFDPSKVNVCLPLGAGNTPVTEEWELVNVAGELHNFHMHQTKFFVYPEGAPEGDGGVLMDNVPLPTGGATCDGTVAAWRSGECKVQTIKVGIPFAEVGDFVYHCHIGEHQDGGMMAHIRVIAKE